MARHRKGPQRVCLAMKLCLELLQGGAPFPERASPHYDLKEEDVINILFKEDGNGPARCVHTPFPTQQRRVGVLLDLLTIGSTKMDIDWVSFYLQGEFQDLQNKYKNYILRQIHSGCPDALSGLILENFLNFLSHLRQIYHRKISAETWSKNILKWAWMSCKCSIEGMWIHR